MLCASLKDQTPVHEILSNKIEMNRSKKIEKIYSKTFLIPKSSDTAI